MKVSDYLRNAPVTRQAAKSKFCSLSLSVILKAVLLSFALTWIWRWTIDRHPIFGQTSFTQLDRWTHIFSCLNEERGKGDNGLVRRVSSMATPVEHWHTMYGSRWFDMTRIFLVLYDVKKKHNFCMTYVADNQNKILATDASNRLTENNRLVCWMFMYVCIQTQICQTSRPKMSLTIDCLRSNWSSKLWKKQKS